MEKIFDDNLISIIIPTYNCEKYISLTLDSVLRQKVDKNLEIILIDDCSVDATIQLIDTYISKYKNIYLLKNTKNVGAGESRNNGISFAKGRYIAFIDADDIWKEDKLQKQITLISKKNALLSYTAIEMIDGTGNLIKTKRKVKTEIDYKFLLKNTMIANSSVMIDRNLIPDFKMSSRRLSHDYSTWLKLLRNGCKAYGINEALVSYRVHSSSLSSNKLKSAKYIWDIQRQDEHIPIPFVLFNIACWSVNSILKYFF